MPFTNPQKKKSRRVKSGERWGQGMVPLFLFNDQEIPCPERHEHGERSEGRYTV
jgi:hypothetical protein